MSDNSLKLPFAQSLVQAIQRIIKNELGKLGYALPCSVVEVNGALVKVNFLVNGIQLPQVVVPIAESEYVRLPIQRGCLGFTIPADAYLGGVSGLGGGAANLWQQANLSNSVFFPIGNANWGASDDPNKLELYGQSGVIIRSKQGGTIKIDIDDATGNITVTVPSGGDLIVNGISARHHTHSGVTTGSSNSGPPV